MQFSTGRNRWFHEWKHSTLKKYLVISETLILAGIKERTFFAQIMFYFLFCSCMPFTFCHPAAVLVFNYFPKKWISLTGLIVGSLSPDFEYFIRMQKLSLYSHSLGGLFFFDLPVGLVLTFIYYKIVHKTVINNLPFFI